MNDKEAIEILKDIGTIDFYNNYSEYTFPEKEVQEKCKAIETILNIIEKQKAEIEEKNKIIRAMVDIEPYIYRRAIMELEKQEQYFEKKAEEDK